MNPPGGFNNPINRVYATHGAQPYHTDSSDLVALLCLKPAKVGGYSTWASSYSIYNALLQTQPELVEALAEEWYLDRKDEIPEGQGPWFKLPVFSWHKVQTGPLHSFARMGNVMSLTCIDVQLASLPIAYYA